MSRDEFRPGERVPRFGLYEALNVFGAPTGEVIIVTAGESFPAAPRGFSWRALGGLSASELHGKAARYRAMALTASTAEVRDALLRLAERLDAMADGRDAGGPEQ